MTLYADPVAMDLVFDGHTTYTFDPMPLPDDTAERLYDLVKHAPTAFNAQPMRLFAVTEQTGDGTRSTAQQVRELSRMAEELRQSVARFKIA